MTSVSGGIKLSLYLFNCMGKYIGQANTPPKCASGHTMSSKDHLIKLKEENCKGCPADQLSWEPAGLSDHSPESKGPGQE